MNKIRNVGALLAGAAILTACAPYEPPPTNGPPPPGVVYETRGRVAPPDRYAANTGVISSIEVIRGERASGVSPGGAILGAVVGGVLGNQIGEGRGRTAATVAGAGVGALAGNAVGNRVNSTSDMIRVGIQYDRGGYQYIDVSDAGDLRQGDRVRVDGNQISRY